MWGVQQGPDSGGARSTGPGNKGLEAHADDRSHLLSRGSLLGASVPYRYMTMGSDLSSNSWSTTQGLVNCGLPELSSSYL